MTSMVRQVLVCSSLFLAQVLPASGQWAGPGQWGQEGNQQFVEPGTWITVFSDAAQERIIRATAQGMNFTGTMEFWCRRDLPTGGLRFWNFFGSALQRVPEDHPETTEQAVRFKFDDQSYRVVLTYTPWEGVWTAFGLLDADFLEAWASSNKLEIMNLSGDTVTIFGLAETRAARNKMEQVCKN